MKLLYALRVKSKVESLKRTKLARIVEIGAPTNTSGAKESMGFQATRRSQWAKNL
jgi:hypothetical protein